MHICSSGSRQRGSCGVVITVYFFHFPADENVWNTVWLWPSSQHHDARYLLQVASPARTLLTLSPFFDPQVEPPVSHSQNITPVTKSGILGIVERACIAGVVVGRSQEMKDDGGSKSKPRLSRSR